MLFLVPAFGKLRYLCCVSRSHLEITFGELSVFLGGRGGEREFWFRHLMYGRSLFTTKNPDSQCMVYLPTFGQGVSLGKYNIQ